MTKFDRVCAYLKDCDFVPNMSKVRIQTLSLFSSLCRAVQGEIGRLEIEKLSGDPLKCPAQPCTQFMPTIEKCSKIGKKNQKYM